MSRNRRMLWWWRPSLLWRVACGIVLAVCPLSCNRASPSADLRPGTLPQIEKTKILRVGYVDFPPIVFKDPQTGVVRGQFVLAVEEIAKQLGVKCEYIEATWATFAAGLQNRQFDLSIAPTFATVPRATSVSFSRPLMYVGSSAIIKKGDMRFRALQDIDREGIVVSLSDNSTNVSA